MTTTQIPSWKDRRDDRPTTGTLVTHLERLDAATTGPSAAPDTGPVAGPDPAPALASAEIRLAILARATIAHDAHRALRLVHRAQRTATRLHTVRLGVLAHADDAPVRRDLQFPVLSITPHGTRGAADHGCRFTLPAALLFDGDSATLRPGAAASLRSTVDLMRRHPRTTAQIIGHTATDPGASAASMQRFSQLRAQAVAGVFRSAGIAAARLRITGVGDREPLAEDIDPATGRQLPRLAAAERRVDIAVVGTGCPAP